MLTHNFGIHYVTIQYIVILNYSVMYHGETFMMTHAVVISIRWLSVEGETVKLGASVVPSNCESSILHQFPITFWFLMLKTKF